jgi:hypothetical protein
MMRVPTLACLLVACAHDTAKPIAPAPAPAPAEVLPADCSPNGVMGAPEDPTPIRALDPTHPRETIELLTCKFPPPPYEPKLDEDGKPDETDAYWHSFSSWKAYFVRAGTHPFTWDTGLGVGQYHEGYAEARVVGVVPGPVPLVVVDHESGGMGVHTQELVVFRVDAPPQQVETYSGDELAAEMTPKGFVLSRCYRTDEQSEHGESCMSSPDQIETLTLSWNGTELATIAKTPYKLPPPKN